MTNYPITDPAEIAKLPPAHYLCVDGTTATRRHGKTLAQPWSVEGRELFLTDAKLADLRGGIAGRLVLEPPRLAPMFKGTGKTVLRLAQAEAQRDRAVELLRRVLGDLEHGPGGNEIDGATADLIGGFLAAQEGNEKQQPCQRCGGEGRVIKPDAPGIRTRWYEDCPDCQAPFAE